MFSQITVIFNLKDDVLTMSLTRCPYIIFCQLYVSIAVVLGSKFVDILMLMYNRMKILVKLEHWRDGALQRVCNPIRNYH